MEEEDKEVVAVVAVAAVLAVVGLTAAVGILRVVKQSVRPEAYKVVAAQSFKR